MLCRKCFRKSTVWSQKYVGSNFRIRAKAKKRAQVHLLYQQFINYVRAVSRSAESSGRNGYRLVLEHRWIQSMLSGLTGRINGTLPHVAAITDKRTH